MPCLTHLLRWLHALDARPFYAVVAPLLGRWPIERSYLVLQTIFSDLESYVVRRGICGLPQNDSDAVSHLVRALQAPDSEWHAVRNILLASTGNRRWPCDEEFAHACANTPLAAQLPPDTLLLLLTSLNEYLERKESRRRPAAAAIEYVYPLQPTAEAWSLIAAPPAAIMVQQLGNLALVVRPFSAAVSNGPFARKRGVLARQGPLLNMDLYDYPDEHPWGAADIARRGRQLSRLAVRAWPRG